MAIECLPSEARFQMLYYEQLDIAKMRIAEITTLRETLRVAEKALVKCRYRSLCDEVVDEALAKIREVK